MDKYFGSRQREDICTERVQLLDRPTVQMLFFGPCILASLSWKCQIGTLFCMMPTATNEREVCLVGIR